jgi:hypothetical protein
MDIKEAALEGLVFRERFTKLSKIIRLSSESMHHSVPHHCAKTAQPTTKPSVELKRA